MPGDLYARVYHLPDRLVKARANVTTIRRRLDWIGNAVSYRDRIKLENAERRLRSLENEAR